MSPLAYLSLFALHFIWLLDVVYAAKEQIASGFQQKAFVEVDKKYSRVESMRRSILSSFTSFENQAHQAAESRRVVCNIMITDVSDWLSKSFLKSEVSTYSVSETVKLAQKYLSANAAWEFSGQENDVSVWKLDPSSINLRHDEKQWPCVKSSTIIKIDPKTLVEYLMDSSKVPEYNRYCAGRTDVEKISKRTKIVWNRTAIPLAIKSYDFCTLMHYYVKSSKNEYVLVSKGVQHPLIPVHKDYSRSENIIGLNILRPLKGSEKNKKAIYTEITCISHVKYGGTLPYVIKKSLFRGTVKYLHNLKEKIHGKY
jgi:hypothetical protein